MLVFLLLTSLEEGAVVRKFADVGFKGGYDAGDAGHGV